jgi:hypothetical protein
MRYVLSHVVASGSNYYTNYKEQAKPQFELVSEQELQTHSFEQIILSRFAPFIGKNYTEICSALEVQAYQAKNKYAPRIHVVQEY